MLSILGGIALVAILGIAAWVLWEVKVASEHVKSLRGHIARNDASDISKIYKIFSLREKGKKTAQPAERGGHQQAQVPVELAA